MPLTLCSKERLVLEVVLGKKYPCITRRLDQGEYFLTGMVNQDARTFDSTLQRKVELESLLWKLTDLILLGLLTIV